MVEDPGSGGSWIFISHSHKDLERVRRIRNALEERGHNPLLFFLKCLDDDSEVDDLVRREIETRTWFVLCDSTNARDSRWVQTEIEIIKSLEGKVFVALDLDDDFDDQLRKIDTISKRSTVFISHHEADKEIAQSIASALREQDYAVVSGEGLAEGDDLAAGVTGQIRPATERGFFLLLLSPEAVGSLWIREELEVAYAEADARERRASVMPVVVRDHQTTLCLLSSSPELTRLIADLPLTRTYEGHETVLEGLSMTPDGSFIVSGGDQTVRIWDTGSGEQRMTLSGHTDRVTACAVSPAMAPDGSVVVSGSSDGTLKVWDAGSGVELATLEGHTDRVTSCAVSPDGSFIVSGSADRTVKVWDARTAEALATVPLLGWVASVALHPQLPLVAAGDARGNLNLIDLAGIEYGPIVVTALDRPGGPTIRCPNCVQEIPVQENWLGTEITCPTAGCDQRLRVNSFVVGRR